jgi:hypothetical protein
MGFTQRPRYALPAARGQEVPVITGPDGGAAGHGLLRASHADREQVIDTLKTAFADGRLDKKELDRRVGGALAAWTYGELATASAGIPAAPAQAPPPGRPARPPVTKGAVKWSLCAAGAMIPPALFVTALFGAPTLAPLAFLALPLLFIELPVVIIFVVFTLARQRNDRLRASRGQLPPRPGQAGRAGQAGRHGSAGPDPAPPGAGADPTSADLRIDGTRRDRPRRCGQGVPVPRGARPAPGAA